MKFFGDIYDRFSQRQDSANVVSHTMVMRSQMTICSNSPIKDLHNGECIRTISFTVEENDVTAPTTMFAAETQVPVDATVRIHMAIRFNDALYHKLADNQCATAHIGQVAKRTIRSRPLRQCACVYRDVSVLLEVPPHCWSCCWWWRTATVRGRPSHRP